MEKLYRIHQMIQQKDYLDVRYHRFVKIIVYLFQMFSNHQSMASARVGVYDGANMNINGNDSVQIYI